MELLEKIYRDYRCTINYELASEIDEYLKQYVCIHNPEVDLQHYISAFFMKAVDIWIPVKPDVMSGKLCNLNENYIVIPKDRSNEIHILIYRKKVQRVKAWDLSSIERN